MSDAEKLALAVIVAIPLAAYLRGLVGAWLRDRRARKRTP